MVKSIPKGFKMTNAISLPRPTLEEKPDNKVEAKKAQAAFSKGVIKGMTAVETELKIALDNALGASVWTGFNPKYPYYRKDGTLMGSGPRDIVDTGNLMESLRLKTDFKQTKSSINIAYDVPYARLVHEGGAIVPYGDPKNATVILPARPWITATLEGTHGIKKYDPKKPFLESISDVWNGTM